MPELLERCTARWSLEIEQPLHGGYLARCFACRDGEGNPRVLKLSPPEANPALEAAALRIWDGRSSVVLKDWDPTVGALLLDRIIPGTSLPSGQDMTALGIAGDILSALHDIPVPTRHSFPSLWEAFTVYLERARAEAESETAGAGLLDLSREAAQRLCSVTGDAVLLHGDFMDKNLLLGASGVIAIDPMPRLGDPCSDIGFFAATHPPARDIVSRAENLARRLHRDPGRSTRWAAVWAVGEACETWREDSDELRGWISGRDAQTLLRL